MAAQRIQRLLLAAGVTLLATGCATILSGTDQSVMITSNPPGARVIMGDQTARTPVSLILPKGGNIPIEISQGPDRRMVTLRRKLDPMTLLNLIPPLWPGFIVDAVTGALTEYNPDTVHVDFRTRPPVASAHTVRYKP